jgi:rhamnose utilization protein RhaD (predicted bifunctional aldolase and dehydrogenase)
MLFVDDVDLIEQSIDNYKKRNNCFPRIVALKNTGVFTLGESRDSSKTAMLLFIDALKISVYAESFGGAKFMNKEQIDFIKNWEVEKFRSKISQGNEK